MANRQAAEDFIIKYIYKITGSKFNVDRYKEYFKSLNDKQFKDYMADLKSGKKYLTIQIPNFSDSTVTVENNIKIADTLKHSFFQKLLIGATSKTKAYLTPETYLVVDLPFRRASQRLDKKISVAENNRVRDTLTGQVAGDSKTSKMSYPELQIAAAMDLEDSLIELIKYRGGDLGGANALDSMLKKYGHASIKVLQQYSTGVESTKTLKTFLSSAHLKSTL